MAKTVFITGTGTDVGKTYVSGLILKKLVENGIKGAYYKAAMSGNERGTDGKLIPGDAKFVRDIARIEQPLSSMCPYVYEAAVSPHLAARLEGNPVEKEPVKQGLLDLCDTYEYVTMEGSGGIICPISFDQGEWYLWEMVKELHLSCIIVADAGLGTINDVVLTVSFMKQKGIGIEGIVFNHYHPGNLMEQDNQKMCEHLTGIPVIGYVEDGASEIEISLERLLACYQEGGVLA